MSSTGAITFGARFLSYATDAVVYLYGNFQTNALSSSSVEKSQLLTEKVMIPPKQGSRCLFKWQYIK